MTHPLRRLGALLALLVVGATLSSVAATSPARALFAAAPTAGVDEPGRPEVGDCHTVSTDESADAADPDPAVDCSKKHTTRTFHVFDVPKDVKMGNLEAVGEVVSKRCRPVWEKTVGGALKDRYQTTFSYLWFVPTKAQQNKGARWVRCDLAIWSAVGLEKLPNDHVPAIGKKPYPDAFARCHLGKQGDYRTTTCSRPHASRSKGVFAMKGKAYPSDQARYNAAKKQCPRFTGRLPWRVFYPTEEQWKAGFKLFLCDAQTKS